MKRHDLYCDSCEMPLGDVMHAVGNNGANIEMKYYPIDDKRFNGRQVGIQYIRVVHNKWGCTSELPWCPIAHLGDEWSDMHRDYDFRYCSNYDKLLHVHNLFYGKKHPITKKPQKINAIPSRVMGHVYLLRCNNLFKIGKGKDVQKRVRQLQTASPFVIEHLHTIRTNKFNELERDLHQRFASKRVRGEWFELSAEDVEYITSL